MRNLEHFDIDLYTDSDEEDEMDLRDQVDDNVRPLILDCYAAVA